MTKKYNPDSKYARQPMLLPAAAPLATAISSALVATSLSAATITVTSLQDNNDPGQCTLRSALHSASANTAHDSCSAGETGVDSIVFQSGLSGTIQLQVGAGNAVVGDYYDGSTLPIDESVIVEGDGRITLQGSGEAPVLYARQTADSAEFRDLTIVGGGGQRGGGILARTNELSVINSRLQSSTVTGEGAAIFFESFANIAYLTLTDSEFVSNVATSAQSRGGGVAASLYGAYVVIDNCEFRNNSAAGGGGLYFDIPNGGAFFISDSAFEQNAALNGSGGGAAFDLNHGELFLSGSDFSLNQAAGLGGGLYFRESLPDVRMTAANISGSFFYYNEAGEGGGGAALLIPDGENSSLENPTKVIDIDSSVFFGNDSDSTGGGLHLVTGEAVVTGISNTELSLNVSEAGGGGVFIDAVDTEASLDQVNVFLNTAATQADGGGLLIDGLNSEFLLTGLDARENSSFGGGGAVKVVADESTIRLIESDFWFNESTLCGGAIDVEGRPSHLVVGRSRLRSNYASCGGGFSVVTPADQATSIEVKYSEFSQNSADTAPGDGGAIYADMGTDSTLLISNSTVSGNFGNGNGGGMRLTGNMAAQVKYSTIAENDSYFAGAGIFSEAQSCGVYSTILSNNVNNRGSFPQDLAGSPPCDLSVSLIESANYSNFVDSGGNILDQSAQLGPLADNGGNGGRTHALSMTSPARDASVASPPFDHDQRGPGFPRVFGAAMDMGAFELDYDDVFNDRFEQP